ncbi:MAG: hypothetical protein GX867_10560 [Tissierellia bacterium]|jgi:hypothetical protein|nr:hypothetical protein [Sedimentibacter sp.]NLA14680.1 hypothetical protein [Tissierellia bacterium]HQK54598.1 hypothetical protein [Sedimentibacter sp.]
MKKTKFLLIIILVSSLIITSCGGSEVTSVKKTETDAPERAQSLANDSDNAAEEVEHQIEPKLYRVGETAIVDDAYAITIIGVVETEERNQFSDKQVEQVLIIDYIYENLSLADEDIYISDMNFKFVDEGGNMCDSYPVGEIYPPEHTPMGARTLTSMTIGTINHSNEIRVLYYNNMFDSKPTAEFILTVGTVVEPDLFGQTPVYENMYSAGDIIEIKTESGDYTLCIDSVKLITERNQFSDKTPAEVYKIAYTYSNISHEEDIYISEMDFRIIDKNGNMAFSYPGNTSKYPQATIKGARCSAEMIIGTHTEGDVLILCYTDNLFSNTSDVKILLNTK